MERFIIGSIICGDGQTHEDMSYAKDFEDGKDKLIDLINENREWIEQEKASQAHWKNIDNFLFFIGLIDNDTIPTIDDGSMGEILINGVDMIYALELSIYDEIDFDKIIDDLKSFAIEINE